MRMVRTMCLCCACVGMVFCWYRTGVVHVLVLHWHSAGIVCRHRAGTGLVEPPPSPLGSRPRLVVLTPAVALDRCRGPIGRRSLGLRSLLQRRKPSQKNTTCFVPERASSCESSNGAAAWIGRGAALGATCRSSSEQTRLDRGTQGAGTQLSGVGGRGCAEGGPDRHEATTAWGTASTSEPATPPLAPTLLTSRSSSDRAQDKKNRAQL